MPSKIDNRHKIIGGHHRAMARYYMIAHRVNNTETKKNSKYKGIRLIVSKEDFIKWFMSLDFDGASVDRIDSRGDYELSNMRLIPLAANIAKDKLVSTGGYSRCYVCKKTKPIDEFVKESRRLTTGRSTICKPCESARKTAARVKSSGQPSCID